MKKKNDQIVFLAEAISTYRFNGMQRTNVFFFKREKEKKPNANKKSLDKCHSKCWRR